MLKPSKKFIKRLNIKKKHMEYNPTNNLITKKDYKKGWKKYQKQIKTRGFSDSDLWSFDITLAEYILPRLIRFRLMTHGYPGSLSEYEMKPDGTPDYATPIKGDPGFHKWMTILERMIIAFKIIVDGQDYFAIKKKDQTKIDEGLDLFRKYYFNLWD